VSFHYSLFGFGFTSNVELPGFAPNGALVSGACELHLGSAPPAEIASQHRELIYTSLIKDLLGNPALRMWSVGNQELLHLTYTDGHQFWFDRQRKHVWGTWPENSCLEEATSYLLGPVLGILLRYKGVVCLHGSSVAINEQAVTFVGPPGAGKSTTATALARRGYKVLADDITAIGEVSGVFHAYPAYPALWLWPDSVNKLYGNSLDKPSVAAKSDKTRLSESNGVGFEVQSLPLARIYVLNSGDPAGSDSVQENFLALVANTYATNVLTPEMRKQEFITLTRLASQASIRRLGSARDFEKLQERCDQFLDETVLRQIQ
jgi:hypothetical protein